MTSTRLESVHRMAGSVSSRCLVWLQAVRTSRVAGCGSCNPSNKRAKQLLTKQQPIFVQSGQQQRLNRLV